MRKYITASALILILCNACNPKPNNDIVIKKPTNTPRNIVLIICDDVGAEQVESYVNDLPDKTSYHPVSLPAFARLEEAGIRFTQAWSNPTCSPTRAGIYTGQYSCTHGIYSPSDVGNAGELEAYPSDKSYTPLPLKMPCEYRKGFFGKWHLGNFTDVDLPLEHGWDHYAGCLEGELRRYIDWDKTINGGPIGDTTVHATIDLANDAEAWIHARCIKGDPFLAVLAFNAAHSTDGTAKVWHHEDLSPECVDTASISSTDDMAIYHGQLMCLDNVVGNLIDYMKTNHLSTLENTVFIIIGDNGTPDAVGEGVVATGNAKATLKQGGVHVPFIIADGYWLANPNSTGVPVVGTILGSVGRIINPGSDCDELVHTRDIYATILELAGITEPEKGTKSHSLVKFMKDPNATGMAYLFTEDLIGEYAVRTKNYKLIQYYNAAGTFLSEEFYDISGNQWDETQTPHLSGEASVAYAKLVTQIKAARCP